MTGRFHLGHLDPWELRAFAGTSSIIAGFALPNEPWRVTAVVCLGTIEDAETLADALEAAVRGADLAVTVDESFLTAFLDDARRAGLVRCERDDTGTAPEWPMLLDALVAGASIAEAARACHMSLRSAYRRLAEARESLDAPTTTAAVATWARASNDWQR